MARRRTTRTRTRVRQRSPGLFELVLGLSIAYSRSKSKNRLENARLELIHAQIRDRKAMTFERLTRAEMNQAKTELLRIQREVINRRLLNPDTLPLLGDGNLEVDYCPRCGEGYSTAIDTPVCIKCGARLQKAIGVMR